MELFYSKDISSGAGHLDEQESGHCIKVLRHKSGDAISVVDGRGTLYECRITDANPRGVSFQIENVVENYGSHSYYLHMAVAPPKNIDRFEWFTEKATEIGVDRITPLIGEYSERKVFKKECCERIVISAAKQSHKGAVPTLDEAVKVTDFLDGDFGDAVKMICYCEDSETLGVAKHRIKDILADATARGKNRFVIMIGPEGDFSRSEIKKAVADGWQLTSLGESRLRIETAALTAVAAVYMVD